MEVVEASVLSGSVPPISPRLNLRRRLLVRLLAVSSVMLLALGLLLFWNFAIPLRRKLPPKKFA